MANHESKKSGVTRRDVLAYTAAGMGLAALGPIGGRWLEQAQGAPAGNPFVVVINQLGGNDGLNTVVPITLTRYYERRESLGIAEGDALSLEGGPGTTSYRLHPALVNLQSLWNDGDVAIVNKVGYPSANLSHFSSEDIYSFAVRNGFTDLGLPESGWLARFADLYAPTAMGAVSAGVGRRRDFVGGESNSLLVSRLEGFEYDVDWGDRNDHTRRLETIRTMLGRFARTGLGGDVADSLQQGHELTDQIQAALDSYEQFGSTANYQGNESSIRTVQRGLRDIATLVNYGFETQIYYTGHGGFDTHGDQGTGTGRHATLLHRLDSAVGAFAEDMKAMGVWDKTAIVVISEFGRRTYINGSNGTDHGHGNCFFVIGGAVQGGMYGPDLTDADIDERYLGYEIDFRDIYRSLLQGHLGVDPAPVLPEAQETNNVLGLV